MKQINEKTFELNITNELLNVSKSFLWYLLHSPLLNHYSITIISELLNNSVVFATGLSQAQEADPNQGGYDVSINLINPNNVDEVRLLFIQYKAGTHTKYCMNKCSSFKKNTDTKKSIHVLFTFNDDSKNAQHSVLCRLARKKEICQDSVLYAFPRITNYKDFTHKIGRLIEYTSFVPALDINKQAFNKDPSINVEDNKYSQI